MSIGGFKEVDALTRPEWVAYRDVAHEALEAWQNGEQMHVSGTTEEDLAELALYCDTQVVRVDQGLPVAGVRWPLRAVMKAMRRAVDEKLAANAAPEEVDSWTG